MYSFYFITNNQAIREKLKENGYIEYPKTKEFVYQQIISNNARKATLCRTQQFIDVEYLLDRLINPRTTNLIMHKGDVIVGIWNFYFVNEEVETQGICIDQSESKGAGTLFINYLKSIAIALDAVQIKLLIVDNAIAPFYEKNGFRKINDYTLIYNIHESNKITTTETIGTGGKKKSSKLKKRNNKRRKTYTTHKKNTKTHKKKYKKMVR
jgi:hypothetical protein